MTEFFQLQRRAVLTCRLPIRRLLLRFGINLPHEHSVVVLSHLLGFGHTYSISGFGRVILLSPVISYQHLWLIVLFDLRGLFNHDQLAMTLPLLLLSVIDATVGCQGTLLLR